jgi:hypothetical protein
MSGLLTTPQQHRGITGVLLTGRASVGRREAWQKPDSAEAVTGPAKHRTTASGSPWGAPPAAQPSSGDSPAPHQPLPSTNSSARVACQAVCRIWSASVVPMTATTGRADNGAAAQHVPDPDPARALVARSAGRSTRSPAPAHTLRVVRVVAGRLPSALTVGCGSAHRLLECAERLQGVSRRLIATARRSLHERTAQPALDGHAAAVADHTDRKSER